MPRYNVEKEPGIWLCFSTIVDDFVTDEMKESDYQKWRKEQYEVNCGPIREANLMTYEEAQKIIKANK